MNLRIDDITREGIRFDRGVEQSRLDTMLTDMRTPCRALAPVEVDLRLSRAGERIIVEGTLSTRVQVPCRRCLGSIEADVPARFRMDLLPLSSREPFGVDSEPPVRPDEEEAEGSFSLESADREYYDGETLDMWPIVREQILLVLPDYPLCHDECKGLCQACGADLNVAECGCDRRIVDPRLAGLSKFKV